MDLCSITPVSRAQWMFTQPRVMLLTHLVERYPEYTELAFKSNSYKIVDNSIVELGDSVSMERIYETAKKVKAQEIILMDAYPDGPKTIEAIKKSLEWLVENDHIGEFKIQAVCHGRNLEEFKSTFEFINNNPLIDVIGIPKVLSSWCGERWKLFDIFKNTSKEIHFLGSWYSLKEILDMPKEVYLKVRSCDTCLPCLYVIQNKDIRENREGTIDLEKEYPILTEEKYNSVMNKIEKEIVASQLGVR